MKTKSLFIAALVTMCAIVTAVGKDEPRKVGLAVVAVKGSEVFKVIYKGENTGKVKLNVYNAQSQIIFSETLNAAEGFIRPLNFGGLAFGEYVVELIDASGKKIEKVTYARPASKSSIHVSKLAKEEGKYMVSVANVGNEKVRVRIYDSANNLVHTETKEVSGSFAQLYTIKNATGVTFEITDSLGNTKTTRF